MIIWNENENKEAKLITMHINKVSTEKFVSIAITFKNSSSFGLQTEKHIEQ